MGAWSPPGGQPQTGFDVATFKKLVARFDSNHAGEAETAFRKAILLCVQAQLRFSDAATEAFGQSDRATELESELAAVRELLDQREKQGAALADTCERLQRESASYRCQTEQEIARLRRTAGSSIGQVCRACEWKRAALAIIAGWPIGKLWFEHRESFSAFGLADLEPAKATFYGILLVATPLLAAILRWGWIAFKRKYSWLSWRNNDIYRGIATRWNAFLQRLTMT